MTDYQLNKVLSCINKYITTKDFSGYYQSICITHRSNGRCKTYAIRPGLIARFIKMYLK